MANTSSGGSPLRPRFGGVLFNGAPPRAKRLRYASFSDGPATGIRFDLDDRFAGAIRVDWSELGGPPTADEGSVLGIALAALVAQHAQPLRIEGSVPLSAPAAEAFHAILQMLYDVRSFCDETPWRRIPRLLTSKLRQPSTLVREDLCGHRVLVLLSGGFDSALAAILLQEAGFEVICLHVRTNRHVEQPEETAARVIGRRLASALYVVRLDFPDQERIGRYYSRTFGEYPFYNSVPHGRDFPLSVLAAIAARRLGCYGVAFGHERESREKFILDRGRTVYRHDVESAYGAQVTQQFLTQALCSGVCLFSPVAGISIYRIRSIMFRYFPEITSLVQSCFWSRRCERCLKCVSTYAMQRDLGLDLVPFTQNPFADQDDPDMALLAEPDRPTEVLAYGPQMHYAMARIVREHRVQADDYWLLRFEQRGLFEVERRWQWLENLCRGAASSTEVPGEVTRVVDSLQ
jgi:7-cyano-7-deazaguanine synthase in queuosine biosynthesis